MDRKMRWAASVALGVCWALLWPWLDQCLAFSAPSNWKAWRDHGLPEPWSKDWLKLVRRFSPPSSSLSFKIASADDGNTMLLITDLLLRGHSKWRRLPESLRQNFLQVKSEQAAKGFLSTILHDLSRKTKWKSRFDPELKEIAATCSHVLGDDIVVQRVGSLSRLTALSLACDLDLQVTRCPESHRTGTNFTEADKQKVAQYLENLDCVTGPVTIGNVSIKFQLLETISVDLVLRNPSEEHFPRLRGGKNPYRNFDRINNAVKQTPALCFAIVGVKLFLPSRLKGILLEAIAWRVAEIYPLRLTSGWKDIRSLNFSSKQFEMECFQFFLFLRTNLILWESSSFGRELKLDLQNLPRHKQDEYMDGLNMLGQPSAFDRAFDPTYTFLFLGVFCRAMDELTEKELKELTGNTEIDDMRPFIPQLPNAGPFVSHLRKKLSEFFPFDF